MVGNFGRCRFKEVRSMVGVGNIGNIVLVDVFFILVNFDWF